jgi:hypothetical protein
MPCCPGFFCPAEVVCAIPCSQGGYCPLANDTSQNSTDPFCTPYDIQRDTSIGCGGAPVDNPCPQGNYCPTPIEIQPCPEGNYCPSGSTEPRRCPGLSICKANSAIPGWNLIGLVFTLALAFAFVALVLGSKFVKRIKLKRLQRLWKEKSRNSLSISNLSDESDGNESAALLTQNYSINAMPDGSLQEKVFFFFIPFFLYFLSKIFIKLLFEF